MNQLQTNPEQTLNPKQTAIDVSVYRCISVSYPCARGESVYSVRKTVKHV